jgi:hypothetical protein
MPAHYGNVIIMVSACVSKVQKTMLNHDLEKKKGKCSE